MPSTEVIIPPTRQASKVGSSDALFHATIPNRITLMMETKYPSDFKNNAMCSPPAPNHFCDTAKTRHKCVSFRGRSELAGSRVVGA